MTLEGHKPWLCNRPCSRDEMFPVRDSLAVFEFHRGELAMPGDSLRFTQW